MSERKEDFIRMYQLTGGSTEGGEAMWAIKCRDKAAPDLLAALKFLVGTIDPYSDWNDDGFQKGLAMARAAIAKAEGREP